MSISSASNRRPVQSVRWRGRKDNAGAAPPADDDLNFSRWLSAVILGLLTVGYPVTGAVTTILNIDDSTLSIAFRILLVFCCFVMVLTRLFRGGFSLHLSLVLFLVWYLGRLLYDRFYGGVAARDIDRPLLFFLSTVMAPAIALSIAPRAYDDDRAAKVVLGLGTVACLLIVYIRITGGFVGQIDYASAEGRLALAALNPITISETGLFTAIAAYALLRRPVDVFFGHWALAAIPLGLSVLVIGGSRGPLVSLLTCLLLVAFVARQLWLVFVLGIATVAVFLTFQVDSSAFLGRIANVGNDLSSLERISIQQSSLSLALRHPVFGFAYVDPVTNSYPHNLLIESFLALGVGGLALMTWLEARLAFFNFEFLRRGLSLLPLIATEALVNAWLSGGLWGSGPIFGCTALLLAHWRTVKTTRADPRGRAMQRGRIRAGPARAPARPGLAISPD